MISRSQAKLFASTFVALAMIVCSVRADDYDGGETETAITGLGGLGGIGGLGGLSALANGVVEGYSPMEGGNGNEVMVQDNGDRGMGASESSDSESNDYDEDSNDSSASEEHPILSKFFDFISGSRNKRSVEDTEKAADLQALNSNKVHSRVKRGYKGWVPYVSTYVKTDKKAHFKWGVKAKVGKKYGK